MRKRCHIPKKTGNALEDNDSKEKINMLKELVSSCLADLDHVQPLYCKLRERQRLVSLQQTKTDKDFAHVKTVRGLPPVFITHFIASNSDLDIAAVDKVYAKNPDDLILLLCFVCQLPEHFRWPEVLHSREVSFRFLNARVLACGNRLISFKADGGIDKNNSVNWKHGCYQLIWSVEKPSFLTDIKHCSGVQVSLPESSKMLKATTELKQNALDFAATLTFPPFPALPVHQFFLSIGGEPKTFKDIPSMSKKESLETSLQDALDAWKEDSKRSALADADAEGLKRANDDVTKTQAKHIEERCKKARVASCAAKETKRQSKVLKYQESEPADAK